MSANFERIYYVGYKGTQIRQAITHNNNTHIERREIAAKTRLQLAWEEDESLLRLITASSEQRQRGLRWDIADHNVYRELLGTVLEMVSQAIDQSEENAAEHKY